MSRRRRTSAPSSPSPSLRDVLTVAAFPLIILVAVMAGTILGHLPEIIFP